MTSVTSEIPLRAELAVGLACGCDDGIQTDTRRPHKIRGTVP